MSGVGTGVVLTPQEVFELLPQEDPFLFVDEVLEVSDDHIVARFTFRQDHDFYRGHFPGHPVTPGVILLESIAQVGVVALGLYLIARDQGRDAVLNALALFTDANVEFTGLVSPGDRVTIRATKVFFRRGKIRSDAEMTLDDGTVVCSGTISGLGMPRS
jgi:3-hydroxyacyl-[acyl-carrier-protein] dehydratase